MKIHKNLAVFGIFFLTVATLFGAPLRTEARAEATRYSSNWSGYVMTKGGYTGVSGTWTVPTTLPVGEVSSNAEWVGIGGYTTGDLIQAGTMAIYLNGHLSYMAWVETLPENAKNLPLEVRPGDSVTVSLIETSPDLWQLNFRNNTTGKSLERTLNYVSSNSSAEWVEEAPLINGKLATLPNFSAANFTQAYAYSNGVKMNLTEGRAEPVNMIDKSRTVLAHAGGVGPDGASFGVLRTNAPEPVRAYAVAPYVPPALVVTPVPVSTPLTTVPQPLPAPAPSPYAPTTPRLILALRFSPTTGLPV